MTKIAGFAKNSSKQNLYMKACHSLDTSHHDLILSVTNKTQATTGNVCCCNICCKVYNSGQDSGHAKVKNLYEMCYAIMPVPINKRGSL